MLNMRIESVKRAAGSGLVHLVATFGRAEMRQASAGEIQVRHVRMIDRSEQTIPRLQLFQIEPFVGEPRGHAFFQRHAAAQRAVCAS